MANYGHSFGNTSAGPVEIERVVLWSDVYERYPSGAVLKKSDSYPEGKVIPAGTPISVSKPGGEATLNSSSPIGLTLDDVTMGADFCTLTIVTRGRVLEDRYSGTAYTTAQKTALKGAITFIKES